MLGPMTAPRGKGIYARQPSFYPEEDPGAYAYAMGCQFVALHDAATSDDQVSRARDLGLTVLLWEGPDSWLPRNWQQTIYSHIERVERLGLDGFIADVERAQVWKGHEREVHELAGTLGSAAQAYRSVGFTSFPSWPWMNDVAAIAAPQGVWGSPQLYGILQPGTPVELLHRATSWHQAFGEVTPSLAAWRRTPEEQADYLEAFRGERGAIFWQAPTNSGKIQPWPGTPGFDVLRDWNVHQPGLGGRGRTFASVAWDAFTHPANLARLLR